MSGRLVVYTYAKCSTCRAAVQWLRARGVAFDERAIRETPPPLVELRAMLVAQPGGLRRLFNSSGIAYRAMKLSEKLPAMSESAALELLTKNGNLVKRPFVLGPGVGLVGFDEAKWAAAIKA